MRVLEPYVISLHSVEYDEESHILKVKATVNGKDVDAAEALCVFTKENRASRLVFPDRKEPWCRRWVNGIENPDEAFEPWFDNLMDAVMSKYGDVYGIPAIGAVFE